MQRLGFTRKDILHWPTHDIRLVIYIIDCALTRPKPNVWDTIRNKLAAKDHYNKLALTPTSWSDNPALFNLTDFCKKHNASDPTNTAIPFTKHHLIRFVEYVEQSIIFCKVQGFSLSSQDRKLLAQHLITPFELIHHAQYISARMTLVATVCINVTGLRLGEATHPDNLKNHNYGIRKCDITFMHKLQLNGKWGIYPDNSITSSQSLHAVHLNIQNSKMRNAGHAAYTVIGRSHHVIDPALMLFDLYHTLDILKRRFPRNYHWNPTSHIFQQSNGKPMVQSDFRTYFKHIIHRINYLNKERSSKPH